MPLTAGTRLGPYEIVSPIGAGGMGEVYKARDTRLDRAVALKVIQASVADSPEMRERFEREARAISALDHPNICILYDVSREGDLSFLVMQYLEGETLADRLARAGRPLSDPTRPPSGSGETSLATISRGPIPFDTALKYAAEIAHALDAAHRRGIVHRDLKPGNVMLTKSGTKLLDFGLAKLAAGSTAPFGDGATRTSPLTSQGAILGTLHYMSPEQLEGRDVDARSDIHAFGALLYEMLTGRRAFEGQSQAGIIASIISADPPALTALADGRTSLPVVAHRALDRLLARCLAKHPDDRWQSAADLAGELQWINEERVRAVPESAALASAAGPLHDRPSRVRERVWMGVAAAAIVALAGVAAMWYPRPAAPPAPIAFTVSPPDGYELSTGPGLLALSPDGRRLAFTTGAGTELKLWLRELGSVSSQRLDRGDSAWHPAWSPDSHSLLFGGAGGATPLRRLDLAGGMPVTLGNDSVGRPAWGSGGILFERETKLHLVPEAGGESRVVMEPDPARNETAIRWPTFLPDGRRYIFSGSNPDASRAGIYLASLDSRDRTSLVNVLSNVDYSGGYLFYQRDSTLMAHPFDANAGRFTGDAFPVVEKVRINAGNGRAAFSISSTGTIAYISEDRGAVDARTISLFDRAGKLIRKIDKAGAYTQATFSPNGRQAIVMEDPGPPAVRTLHLLDLERGIFSRFTVGDVDERSPVWSHDGSHVFFYSVRGGKGGIYRRNAGGGATSDDLILASDEILQPTGISPDGGRLLVTHGLASSQRVWVLMLSGDRKFVEAFPGSKISQTQAQFSHDGKWIAYTESTGPGAGDVYVQPFPADGRRVRVSNAAGGRHAHWSLDGRAIVYRTLKNTVASVVLKPDGNTFVASAPVESFTRPRVATFNWTFSTDAGGSQFLFIEPPERVADLKPSPITVVVNFVQSLATTSR
jgi:serine/threonine protein kinase/Tol biopolymer transport system component